MSASAEMLLEVGKEIKKEIETAAGNEIFIRAQLNNKNIIEEFEVLARGNSYSAPAVINNLMAGEMVIHNHPSGDLTPSAADIRLAAKMAAREVGFAIINNQADQIYVVVEAGTKKEKKKLDKEEVLSYFKKEGKLAGELKGFSERKEQLLTAEKIIDSFNQHQFDFIEAGTGTGKSFAYLIPALFYNDLNQARIVVSTNTINLQEQLINKDLVTLQRVLDFDFNAVLVKGRNNYLCLRKFKNFKKNFDNNELEIDEKIFNELNEWKKQTESGEKSEINFQLKNKVWNQIAAESDLCLKTSCPFYANCFFMQARKKIYKADILIVNHHLLLSDARVKEDTGSVDRGILPNFNHLIIDEAHNIGEIATDHLGYPLYQPLLDNWLKRLSGDKKSLLSEIREDIAFTVDSDQKRLREILDKRIIPTTQKIRDLIPQYFNELKDLISDYKDKKITVDDKLKSNPKWQEFYQTAQDLAAYLKNDFSFLQIIYENLYLGLEAETDESEMKIKSSLNRCQDLIKRIEFNLKAEDDDYVFWLESSYYRGSEQTVQKSAPIDAGKFLPDMIWSKLTNIIFTSATITAAGSFDYFYRETGISKAEELKVESPFDYSKQAELLIPVDFPDPGSKSFLKELVVSLKEIISKTQGSTMVLFTSYRMLSYCYNNLKAELEEMGIRILSQSKLSRNYIMQEFHSEYKTIIFGTSSFWEGVDLPGDLLKYLVMVKLPFPVPGEPLYQAKEDLLKAKGLNPFYNLALPQAVIKFRQGFGRLIRSKKDSGYIILFDRRVKSRSYGQKFLDSIPTGCPVFEINQKEIIKKLENNGV
ncbi:ATP-dependent DNA helicase DinG [Halanaerobium saccharolyticum]|uniref:ATP-dependent DNA helicase DinG n=1 Tax=Halanaerobium saccharolyticum TaxID=43595 RepID=A0A4R6S395_9FIRM|nr:helicase C-terminal domain-containing protein [Halanaerobium saccharolyticum]TDP94149.1 ATP-dependent DNA helicase DinG [Halanaerobium saccharolyticum]